MEVFAVYDVKLEAFGQPFYAPNKAVATRTFQDTVSQPDTQFSTHPDDFILHEIGSYDDAKGLLIGKTPVPLGSAKDYQHDRTET